MSKLSCSENTDVSKLSCSENTDTSKSSCNENIYASKLNVDQLSCSDDTEASSKLTSDEFYDSRNYDDSSILNAEESSRNDCSLDASIGDTETEMNKSADYSIDGIDDIYPGNNLLLSANYLIVV